MSVRVLQSFPHKIGAGRICTTAWYQAVGVADAGGEVTVMTGVVDRPLPPHVAVRTTLSRGRWRIPYGAVGTMSALTLHDLIVARNLPKFVGKIDIVHAWPLAASEHAPGRASPWDSKRPRTPQCPHALCLRGGRPRMRPSRRAVSQPTTSMPTTRSGCARRRRNIASPTTSCARQTSSSQTFRDLGHPEDKLLRHTYGFDELASTLRRIAHNRCDGLNALFVGVCAVRKGLHFALEAWLRSPASKTGTFKIAGEFVPAYETRLADMLAHPSVHVLGHRDDVPQLMRESDILLLPSIEEGFGLTCVEAMGSGCVPLVSDACTDVCIDNENAFVHAVADVATLTDQITLLDGDRDRLAEMRLHCVQSSAAHTWTQAGRRLLEAYASVM